MESLVNTPKPIFNTLADPQQTKHSRDINADGPTVGRNDHNPRVTNNSEPVEYGQKRLASVIPTIFPLRSSSSAALPDSSILRRFPVAHDILTRQCGVTLSTLVTLAYALVLSAHTASSDDVVFGHVRSVQSEENMIEATLAHNLVFHWDQTTLDFLRDLQNDLARIDNHSLVDLREIPVPDIASLCRTILNFYPNHRQTLNVDHDLAFLVKTIGPEEIEVEARFTSALMPETEIKIFMDHFSTALASISQNLTGRLEDINLVSSEERQRLLVEMNPSYPPGTSLSPANNVTELVEEQARKTPQRIALQFSQEQFVTYNQMDAFANNLASTLIGHNVKRGELVGIYMDKSCEMFISMFAIHKAGGGYVPLAPTHPSERIRMILGLADIKIVVTSKMLQSQFDSYVSASGVVSLVVNVHDLSPADKPDVSVDRDDICHVMFTSGSTGTPKGVVLTHGSIIESLVGAHAIIGGHHDRVLQFSDYGFDISVWDWSITLTHGGTLCIVPMQELMDNLSAVTQTLDITFLETTPAVAALIKPEEVPFLQQLVVGGELLTAHVRNAWAEEVILVNTYGPTEASTSVLALTGLTSSTECSNIGHPFGLNIIYVLDRRLRPVPLGCMGELFVGGPQVARGYIKNPEQTTRAFIGDPFRPGSIMYVTGDLVRMSPVDGSVIYLGRRDTQIKIRGHRVEIGEIEEVLKAASKFVVNAVVLKVNIGHDMLIAFLEYPSNLTSPTGDITIIRDETVTSTVSALRSAVRQKLPSYMAPASYVMLNRFPVNLSSKVDRKALGVFFHVHEQEIREHRTDSELFPGLSLSESRAAPRNELQVTLRSLWAVILSLSESSLSIDDDFYALGGDSISAIKIASAAREAGIQLLATDIIQNPTIRTMAHIAESAIVSHDFDDDDLPSVTLERMSPSDLTLMDFDQTSLDALRDDMLPKYGLLPYDVLDVYPCTALQTSFLMAGLLVDDAYVVRQAYDLPSGTNSLRLQQAFEDFINHSNGTILRTVFIFDPLMNRFLQVLMRPGWRRMQWTTIVVTDEAELDVAILKYQDGPGSQKFEQGGLLARACIFELSGAPRALAWSLHHSLADHWTLNNVDRDISDVYARRPLPSRRSFKPMIKYLEGLDRTASLSFWRSHLLDATPTPFPLALPGAPRAIVNATVCREVYAGHSSLTRQFGIMPSSLVTAAWSIVLAAHTGSTDVVFGQVVAGRNAPIKNIDSMAGNLINTVARRVILKYDRSILHTLREIQSEQIEVSKHEHVALADLMSLGIPVSRLVKNLLNFTNLPGDQKQFASETSCTDLLWNRRPDSLDGQDLPFTLTVTPSSTDGFSLLVNYTREVISEVEVKVILDHFEAALLFLAHHPHEALGDINLLSADETRCLLYEWNPSYPLDDSLLSPAQNVSEFIEWQVQRTPERIALQFGQDIFLTYRQMDAFSNSLAHGLLSRGVNRGHLVGIYMDKSVEMFISIIGVHKAGAAFVPLDPEYPSERIQTIIDLAESKIVLVSLELQSQFDEAVVGCGIASILVDVQKLSSAPKPDAGHIGRDDISHVLFTSGSTGTPKGILTTHGCVIESTLSSRELYGLRDDRVLQFSNYTFDFSIWDWSGTLSAGGTLCIVPKRELMNDLGQAAKNLEITFLEVTPTVAALITPEEIPSLQHLVVGGELLRPEVRNTWADKVNLVNVYGPTEASVAVLARNHVTSSTEGSNVGHRLGLNVMYVLDERRRLVPLGCIGELFIGGPQLSRGYLKDPELTAKVFLDDPFRPGSTMYATGDLVRINPVDHSFTYLDRRDTQIKIRGLRVEVGEIEAVVKAASKTINNVAVIKVDSELEGLVAFLENPLDVDVRNEEVKMVHSDSLGSILASVRNAVRQKLPGYMAPAAYLALNRFPLTPSGKLDRRRLAAYYRSYEKDIRSMELSAGSVLVEQGDTGGKTAPQTALQATIRSLWASVLRLSEGLLGLEDDFYAAGGDSVSAIHLARAARQAGLHLPATDIIRNPTIRAMAQIADSGVLDHDFDKDDIPSKNLEQMLPQDLTLLDLDDAGLDRLRHDLLNTHGLSASDILDVYPSTALQTSFLIAGLRVDGAYVATTSYDLPDGTNSARLRQAFEKFIDHSNGMMLRTVFVFEHVSARWLQVLVRPGAKRIEWTTIMVQDEGELEARMDEYQRSDGKQKFENGELLTRVCVFELDGYARNLVWGLHHALTDHWAMNSYQSDIQDAYACRSLPPRRPFKSVIKYLECFDRTTGIEFWRNHLQNATPTSFLQGAQGARPVISDDSLSRDVDVDHGTLTRQFGIMASTLVTAAWSIVLAAHSNCTDVVFGQILAGRNAPVKDIASVTGVTINTVARRVIVSSYATVLETLRRIQFDQIEISKHENITLADLLSEGIPVSTLFKTLLNFRNNISDQGTSSTDDLFRNRRDDKSDNIDFPLGIIAAPRSNKGFSLATVYSSEVISKAEANVILDHFVAALLFCAQHPHAAIADVNLINEHERQRLVTDINPADQLHSAQNVSELIEAQACHTPEKIALQFDQDVFLTYRQMDALSNDLARILITSGVKRGTLVALYMDKSIEMFLSILAIHKAGGGYVPLDPEHPVERTQTIIRLAQVPTVLTTKQLQNQLVSASLDAGPGVDSILVNWKELTAASKSDVGPIGRDDICHILFTSGSTGTPKGVVLTHGSIVESLIGSRELFGRLNGRVLQFSNYTFDFSVWDWSAALSAGGTLCIVPKQQLTDNLGKVAQTFDVTFLETTPTVAALIRPEQIPSLQMLVLGGELLTAEVRNIWADAVNLLNTYGPTETSTSVLALTGVTSSTECSNIGFTFGLNIMYILDERLRLVPLGCVGELFIGGPQVAQGYLADPEQTAKVFIENPFRPGTTMYATGDLVRTSPVDGSVSYLGRRDSQIKIHGLRVEVGEIENILKAATEMITNAAVVKVDIGRECVVAFLEYPSDMTESDELVIIRDDRLGPLLASLRSTVRRKLPSYMAPTVYVALNRFPLTSSGKLDRKALYTYFTLHKASIRDVDAGGNGNGLAYQDVIDPHAIPQTELEAAVRSLWASVLRLSEGSLGMEDDFYAAGGDSVSAIHLARAARQGGLHLPVADIIRNPTIRAMAQIADSAVINHDFDEDGIPSKDLAQMNPRDLTLLDLDDAGLDQLREGFLKTHGLSASDVLDVYPATALQTSFLLAGLVIDSAYVVSAGYDLPSATDSVRLREAFEEFINHSNGMMLRTVFVFEPVSARWLQVVVRPGAMEMEWTTVMVADETELEVRVAEYQRTRGQQQFENGGLLTRVGIFELNGYARVLVWTVHHALTDHWALANYESDIEDAYAHRPFPPRRPFKPMIQYLQCLDRKAGLDYWRSHLENAPATPFLQGFSGGRVISNETITRDVHIDHGSLARQFGIMASTLVTGAWSIVLAAHSNCTDVVFGQVLSGRNAPIKDIGSISGVTLNTVARRVILQSDVTVLETLRRIQFDQIDISKHENITLADLLSEGIPVSTLFKTLLNFRNNTSDQGTVSHRETSSTRGKLFCNPRSDSRDDIDFSLGIIATPRSNKGFFLAAVYSNEVISKAEANVVLDHFVAALLFCAQNPHASIADVNLINESERQRLVTDINPADQLHSAQNVSELIEAQACHTPEKIALQFDQDVFLTYRQMDALSNDLAHVLITSGVKRGTLVALYMDKSIEMFLSILAIHKAGGGYVPLDPEHPAERTQTIIHLAQTLTVLTTKQLQNQLVSVLLGTGAHSILVDSKELTTASKPDVGPIGRDDICHVLFTSGSAGTPKGVVLTHGSIIESLIGSHDLIGRFDGRVLQFSNYTFDVSVWDWGATLTGGGTLCIVPKQQLMDNLGRVAEIFDVTLLETTPTVAALIRPEEIPSLQMLVLGGELLTAEVRNIWADAVNLLNVYGPTETSTNVLALTGVTSSTECSNIGSTFGLNVMYVLDERLRLVPLGCVGELFIGGPQVAQGYLADPEQTAKVFIENPFRPGTTMYATGDLVRMSPVDGSVSYLGRRDSQIKIRGLRVEVGEIETVLKAATEMITNAAVVKVDTERECLVAFLEYPLDMTESDELVIIRDDRLGPLLSSLRSTVRRKLPSYMAPTVYVALNRFSITSSGKLDRKALEAYFHLHEASIRDMEGDGDGNGNGMAYHAIPQTELEAAIRSLWASVLRLSEGSLGMEDDFYTAGGDSVSAIHLARAARQAGLHLPVTDIIRNPTIRAMAQIADSGVLNRDFDEDDIPSKNLEQMAPRDLTLLDLDDAGLDQLREELLKTHGLSASDVLDVYPSTALQTSFLHTGLLIDSAYVVSAGYDLPSTTDTMRLREAFEKFINHPNGMMLRTVFVLEPMSGRWLQALVRPGAMRIDWTVVIVADEAELALRVDEYQRTRGKQQFENGGLLTRVCIFELNGYASVLVWSLHHALTDHWAMRNYKLDIEDAYARRPFPSRRPFKPMIKYLECLDRTAGLNFWRTHLQKAPRTPFLQALPGATCVIANETILRDVQIDHGSLARQFGIMASTLVTAAWSVVLSAHSNCADVVFGQIVAGRNAPIKDMGSVTGVTINTVARRVILNSDVTVLETLRRIQADQIDISKHEHITLADLTSNGIPASGLFNTLLNFRNVLGDQRPISDSSTDTRLFQHLRRGSRDGFEYPLGLAVSPRSTNGFSLAAVHTCEVISQADVEALLDQLEAALRFLAHHPHNSIGDFNPLHSDISNATV